MVERAKKPVVPRKGGNEEQEEEVPRYSADRRNHRIVEHHVAQAGEVGVNVQRGRVDLDEPRPDLYERRRRDLVLRIRE